MSGRTRQRRAAHSCGRAPEKQTLRANPNNLPAPVNRLIGRDDDIEDVRRLLGEHRLVTITGSGGVGKTRVAIEVGRSLTRAYRDGIWLVPLAAVADPSLVAGTVAQALSVGAAQNASLQETLVAFLRPKRALLLIDNCEHVIDEAAGMVEAVLAGCAGVQLRFTSRERLNVAGEWVFRLQSLRLPGATANGDALAPAVELFVERARAVDGRFVVTAGQNRSVAEICLRLDGIPFAIELAAARVGTLSPAQIADRLDARFSLLTGGDRGALPRQQTMRACIDWSYQLLSRQERALLRDLADLRERMHPGRRQDHLRERRSPQGPSA